MDQLKLKRKSEFNETWGFYLFELKEISMQWNLNQLKLKPFSNLNQLKVESIEPRITQNLNQLKLEPI